MDRKVETRWAPAQSRYVHRVVFPHTKLRLLARFLFYSFSRDRHQILLDFGIQIVKLLLYPYRMANCRHDPAVCLDIFKFKPPVFAILQPLFANLVAANAVSVNFLGDRAEVYSKVVDEAKKERIL